MAFTTIQVRHTFKNIDGTPASGSVTFRLSQRITNGGVTYDQQVSVHASLNATGMLSVTLPANNDTATVPAGSTYLVTFQINSGVESSETYTITIPHTAPTGHVTLGTLLPQQEGATP